MAWFEVWITKILCSFYSCIEARIRLRCTVTLSFYLKHKESSQWRILGNRFFGVFKLWSLNVMVPVLHFVSWGDLKWSARFRYWVDTQKGQLYAKLPVQKTNVLTLTYKYTWISLCGLKLTKKLPVTWLNYLGGTKPLQTIIDEANRWEF